MTAHELYKLIEAAQRLLNVGGQIIDLGDGRRAIALPIEHLGVLDGLIVPNQLERELMVQLAADSRFVPS